jgi:hypothetical protein
MDDEIYSFSGFLEESINGYSYLSPEDTVGTFKQLFSEENSNYDDNASFGYRQTIVGDFRTRLVHPYCQAVFSMSGPDMLCSVNGTACLEVFVFADEGTEFCTGKVNKQNETAMRISVSQHLSKGLPNATALRNVSSSDLGWIQEATSRLESGKLMSIIGFIFRCGAVFLLCRVQFSNNPKTHKKRWYDIAATLILVLAVIFSATSAIIFVSMVPLVEFNFIDMYEKRAPHCQLLYTSVGLFEQPEDNILVVLPLALAFVCFTLLFCSLCSKRCKFDSSPSAHESSANTQARGIELVVNVSTSVTKGELSSAASTININNPEAQIDEDNSQPGPSVTTHIDPKTNRRYSYDASTRGTRWID